MNKVILSMANLANIQQQFMDLLQNKPNDLIKHIAKQGELKASERLSIYQNAYTIRLTGVLEQDHEQLGKYLGDTLFDKMVAGYLKCYPSQNTSLREYGDNLPVFLSKTPPFKQHVILADIAFFERLLLKAFDAKEAETLTSQILESLKETDWPLLVLNLHPSVHLISFETSAVESFQALKNDKTPPSANTNKIRHWLIWRTPDKRTEYRSIDQEEFILLNLIKEKKNFSALCQSLTKAHKPETIAPLLINYINVWLSQGLLIKHT
ncbi:Putative DNA-binding domain-containing protein [Pseudoalteromonas denitrificans DSM 6059]|uniref:Putative DNA-binding domain-containing protein n=2 Tax=Pseudoalteromonas TaxID=53246 RepID=A0A1I1N409_9GAMM|nr:Putative DNA-binding domain-containing protein [Pseudoalteromonas denitrificans DSM 6059]